MKLMVNHQTHYQYSDPACNSVQYIRMTPLHNEYQQVHAWDISVPGQRLMKTDAFNNLWLVSSQRFSYQQLTIMAQGIVEIDPNREHGSQDYLHPYVFLQPTPSTCCDEEMREFAFKHVKVCNRDALIKLAEAILNKVPYTPLHTSVHTSAQQAFHAGYGVCQDHSHIFIAMCKALGLPARYVSGYLYVPQQSHLASHAWAEVFLEDAWYCFDISNQMFRPSAHIYVAIGRDYWDVAPVRGIREKGGIETMQSIVQVLAC